MAHVRGVDEHPVEADRAGTPVGGGAIRLARPLGPGELFGRRREHLVGDGDLTGVDGPLPIEAERARLLAFAPVALRVLERRIGRIDGVDASSSCRDDDLAAGEVPEVARVRERGLEVRVDAGVQRCGEIAGSEDHGLETRTGGRDLDRVGHAFSFFDEHLEADAPAQPELRLQLAQQDIEPPDIAGTAGLRDDENVERLAGTGDDLDHVVVAPDRVEPVDPHRTGGRAPVLRREGGHRIGASLDLGAGRARIFEIEEDEVGAGARRLAEHLGAAGRGGELGTANTVHLMLLQEWFSQRR